MLMTNYMKKNALNTQKSKTCKKAQAKQSREKTIFTEKDFLIATPKEMQRRNLKSVDFVFVSGDGYVDHPSFASALLGRLLEKNGFTVAILAQPDYKNPLAFTIFGKPRLAFLVSSGAMDSMVSNYTANNKPRSTDSYAHGGVAGKRPDRASIEYVRAIRSAYKGVNVIIGGIEPSLRRLAHYDYWSNTVKRSILLDSKADLLLYGMGEKSLIEVANALKNGKSAREIRNVRGTCWYTGKKSEIDNFCAQKADVFINGKAPIFVPSFEEVRGSDDECKHAYAESFLLQEANTDAISAATLIEQTDTRFVVQNPPSLPLSTDEMDSVYALPFTRHAHPMYDEVASNGKTGIPALAEVQFSLTSCRGCFGACSFCAISFHQGRRIQTRSHDNILKEAQKMIKDADFKGYIHDIGGPTANFRQDACKKQSQNGACTTRDCLGTKPCKNIVASHADYVALLRKLRALPGVKKVFIRSGIRFDYLLLDKDKTFFRELVQHHISGQLKVAPEHVNDNVLRLMRKSSHSVYEQFTDEYKKLNKEYGKKQYLVPYYIAGHPGADLHAALDVALYLKKTGFVPEQVQDFYPTPGSLSTCMYWTERNPHNRMADGSFEKIYVAKGAHERKLQRALLQFNKKENIPLVKEALRAIQREDALKLLY